MEREIARWRCSTEDASDAIVIEYQHVTAPVPGLPPRDYPGARRLALSTGEPVRYIDAVTFEVVVTGELLRRGPDASTKS